MTTQIKHFLMLPEAKKNKSAIFLGCGPSIKDIDEKFIEVECTTAGTPRPEYYDRADSLIIAKKNLIFL